MSKIKFKGLPMASQRALLRSESRQLGCGNGETVKPHVPDTGLREVWYRTASKGATIVPVTVIKVTPNWLTLLDEQGRTEDVSRLDEVIQYHKTREEAVHAVKTRLIEQCRNAEGEYREFHAREWPLLTPYPTIEEPNNPMTTTPAQSNHFTAALAHYIEREP